MKLLHVTAVIITLPSTYTCIHSSCSCFYKLIYYELQYLCIGRKHRDGTVHGLVKLFKINPEPSHHNPVEVVTLLLYIN